MDGDENYKIVQGFKVKKKKTELPNGFRVCENCDLKGEPGGGW